MTDKYVMIDLSDERTAHVADALTNKTCKKILGLLAERELSESEVSSELKLPINTIDYNVKKLVKAGLIEQTKSFWSAKGKRVPVYRVSNKQIVISPKRTFSGILPAAVISGILALGLRAFSGFSNSSIAAKSEAVGSSMLAADAGAETADGIYGFLAGAPDAWAWFFIGALAGLVIFALWNFMKRR